MSTQELARILKASFNESELRDLCFELQVDYESVSGKNKSDKARELVGYMERHGQFGQLYEQVKKLRPHAIKASQSGGLVAQSLDQNDPRANEAQNLIVQLREYHEQLSEWKELHNHLDETLNIFGQFLVNITWHAERVAAIDTIVLDGSWQPVDRRVERYLLWSKQVKYIGEPYQETDNGEKLGEKWAVEVSVYRQAIISLLQESPAVRKAVLGENRLHKMFRFVPNKSRQIPGWQRWWNDLLDVTREFDNLLKKHMFVTDKELRRTASDLLDLSKLI